MIDPFTALAAIQTAVKLVKTAAKTCQDVESLGPVLGKFFSAKSDAIAVVQQSKSGGFKGSAMGQAIEQMRTAAKDGIVPREGDEAFHVAIASACGNEVLCDTVNQYWRARHAPLFARLGDYFENPRAWRAAVAEHEAVLCAIRAKDSVGARSAMQQHLKKAFNRYSASWRRADAP